MPPTTPATMRCDKSSVAHHQSGTPAHIRQAVKHTEFKLCTKTNGSQALRCRLHLSTGAIQRWKGSLDHSIDMILLSGGMQKKWSDEGRFKKDRAQQIIINNPNIAKYCQILPNIAKYCQILPQQSKAYQMRAKGTVLRTCQVCVFPVGPRDSTRATLMVRETVC